MPTIAGFMNNDYIFTFTWTATTLTCAQSIAIPCNSAQLGTANNACNNLADRGFITMKSEWFDIGRNYIAVISPVNCAARHT